MGAPASSGAVVIPAASRTFQMPTVAVGPNIALIKDAPGSVYGWQGTNVNGIEYVLKLFNLNRLPVLGTDPPLLRVRLAAQLPFPPMNVTRLDFDQGIAMAITQFSADGDMSGVINGNDLDSLVIYFS